MDTREQAGLDIPLDRVVTAVRRETLPVGDYMAEFTDGTRPPVVFERKSLADLFSTMTSGYRRFQQEYCKAEEAGLTLILLIEAPFSRVLRGEPRSSWSGQSMVKKLCTLMIRHRLPVVFCQDRQEAALYVREMFCAVGRMHVEKACSPVQCLHQ